MRYQKLVAPLIEAVKELDIRNSELLELNGSLMELVCLDHPEATVCQ